MASNGKKASKQAVLLFFQTLVNTSYLFVIRCSTPTRLVSVPVGVRNLVPGEPAEGATTGLVVQADPEGVVGTAKHQAVGEGLLEPFLQLKQVTLYFWFDCCFFTFKKKCEN